MISLNVLALLHVTQTAVGTLSTRRRRPRAGGGSRERQFDGRAGRPAGQQRLHLTKFGPNGFAESLRQELLGERVRVSVVEPGTVDSELVNHLGDASQDAARQQIDGIEALRDRRYRGRHRLHRHPRAAGGHQQDGGTCGRPIVVARPARASRRSRVWSARGRGGPSANSAAQCVPDLATSSVAVAPPQAGACHTVGGRASASGLPPAIRRRCFADAVRRHCMGPAIDHARQSCRSTRLPHGLARGLDRLGSGLDELHHVIGVGDHRHVVRRDFDGGGVHAGGELALGIGRDGLIAVGDQEPGRV